ncbi:MAG: site-specific DNA-methyltransferase [Nitrospirae bacterium]|nr:site-specific DNA-methyltransferase [Nitrospirota bacterium]
MPSAEQLRSRLLKKLSELFQLNQPDLDFGFYRIMHAKANEVQAFIETDLLKIVADAFGQVDDARKAELKAKIDREFAAAKEYGVADPENSPKVKEAQAAYDAAKDTAGAEADVYDHLYRFFERYYDDGDFISRRYYTRETSGKAAPFAVPYNGEEVKLHWANADQYYIKSAEYFSNYTFDLRNAKEVQALKGSLDFGEDKPLKVHFRVVDASEGEHGNVKASEANKRFFILHADKPLDVNENGELVVNFEYRPDPEKSGQENTWRDKRNAEAVETILERLQSITQTDDEQGKALAEYPGLLKVPAPTESDKKRPVLAKYVNQYTARNTMDYFIHKDLGGFLRRELDFYIKNEVMRLDDIENAEAPAVESYLAKIKVLRKIAGKLIDFLAQLEDFQKKLWLKKKFIIETNYCVTLDRVPEELYPEIAANGAQIEDWIKLFAIDEIQADLHNPGFSRPMTTEFLKANNKLVLDTRFFDESFKARLVASIENFDEQCDGLLVHSENFQALNLLQERYREQVKCVYIDPPYNTSENAFIYKNAYKHSSWLSMMANGLGIAPALMPKSGILMGAIDDTEHSNLKTLLSHTFGDDNYVGTIAAEVNPAGQNIRPNVPARSHDYFHIFAKDIEAISMVLRGLTPEERKQYKEKDSKGHFYWDNLRRRGGNSRPTDRPKQWFPLFVKGKKVRVPEMKWSDSDKKWIVKEAPNNDETEVWPIDPKGEERIWRVNPDGACSRIAYDEISVIDKAGRQEVSLKSREPEGKKPKTLWSESKYSATSHGTKLLLDILGTGLHFSYPKSIHLTTDAIRYWADETALVLDFFAGSGTTGHSVINLNREDEGCRKYVLVEMGSYFETTLKPRIAKIIYSDSWKNGKPVERGAGISHCFKYIRLESYEDTLNNLRMDENPARQKAVTANAGLKEDYMLRYMLNVETRGSQSLLNIDAFADPTAYTLEVKKPGTDEYATRSVDLIETFNYLIGLRVLHTSAPQTFGAAFKRIHDPELPEDQHTKLVVDGKIRQDADGPWWFRKVEGWVPQDPANPNNDQRENALIVWRRLTGNLEQDNLMLDEWFQKNRISTRDFEFDTIYVNGSNNLPNLKLDDENWKVRLIEEEFMKRMWDVEG